MKASALPLHRASRQLVRGILLKRIGPGRIPPLGYAHRDDYAVFGLVERGSCRVAVDFTEHVLSARDLMCVEPGQAHRIIDAGDCEAALLLVDETFISDSARRLFATRALDPLPVRIGEESFGELSGLLHQIARRCEAPATEDSAGIVRHLTGAALGIFAESLREATPLHVRSGRPPEIMLAFRKLLDKAPVPDRRPSFYAAQLHLSPGYLNEVVRACTGQSAGGYIRRNLVLRAKRQLAYTSSDVREIAFALGFEDAAYFTRLFTKTTGVSPTQFRRDYLG